MSEAQSLAGTYDGPSAHNTLLRELEINPDKQIPINKVAQMVKDDQTQIVEGIRRHCYWHLRRLTANIHYNFHEDHVNMVAFIKDEKNANSAVIKVFLSPKAQDREIKAGAPALEFRFSTAHPATHEDIDLFINPDSFQLNEISIVIGHFSDTKRFPLAQIVQGDADIELQGKTVQAKDLLRQLTWILEPEEDYTHSRATIIELATKYGLSKEEAEKLAQAIHEFGNYYHSDKESRSISQVGMCLTIPGEFERFCRKKFNLVLENAHYGKGDGETAYHEVSTYNRKMVFDWTHRQFEDENYDSFPYPYIYSVEERPPKWIRGETRF